MSYSDQNEGPFPVGSENNLSKRRDIARNMLEALQLKDPRQREQIMGDLRGESSRVTGVKDSEFDALTKKLEDTLSQKMGTPQRAARTKSFLDERMGPTKIGKIDSRPLSERTRPVYARNQGLKTAIKLRKKGFTAASEQAAKDWADSPMSKAPAVGSAGLVQALQDEKDRDLALRKNMESLTQRMLGQMFDQQGVDQPVFRRNRTKRKPRFGMDNRGPIGSSTAE